MPLSFDNTEYAFAYKSDKELRKAQFLFSTMRIGWLVKLALRLTPWVIRAKLPVNELIRNTIFKQFVGGENLQETKRVARVLGGFDVKIILDYGVEGKEGEENFEHAAREFIRVIEYAGSQPNIPFISVKLTALARFALLEKLDTAADETSGFEGRVNYAALNDHEKEEWEKVKERLFRICKAASDSKVSVLIDAEESWIQDPVDALTMQLMERFNTKGVVVYNTIQLYRLGRLQFLKNSYGHAQTKNFKFAVKIVRGAYMEKERRRAQERNQQIPIQPDKEATDRDYNASLEFCIEHLDELFLIVASHNEFSNLYSTELLTSHNHATGHPHIHFSQLYGMSDNITFNLAKAGCSVSKYLPFGPLKDVVPYLMRRAQENSSISGQTGRELALIKNELQRRAAKD
ncbi:MAG: proline dehydrogenase family protein [Ginsengibacter sp.]